MMKLGSSNTFYILILFFLVVLSAIFFGNFFPIAFVDVGRELLIPKLMLEGDVLYKDIFNTYGALPYYFLAIFYKLFGIKISSFTILNTINSFFVLAGIYFLSKEFLSKTQSFLISFCVYSIAITTSALFNFLQPYSICYTFAFCACVYSILFLIKFLKNDKNKNLYLSFLFLGFVFAVKNDFSFLILAFFSILFLYKKFTLKNFSFSLLTFLIFPIIQLSILLSDGLTLNELYNSFLITIKNALTPAMASYCKANGLAFDKIEINKLLSLFYIFLSFLIAKKLILKKDKKKEIIGYVLFSLLIILCIIFSTLKKFFFLLPMVLTILIIYNFKKLYKNPPLLTLGICALAVSSKTFFSLIFGRYGEFSIILLLVFSISFIYFLNKNYAKKILNMLVIFCSITLFFNLILFKNMDYREYQFNNQKIILHPQNQFLITTIVNWLNKNTLKENKVLIFPEGAMINFITNQKTHPMFYNLHDITIQTFDFKYIKENIKTMDYIIDISDFKYNGTILTKYLSETNFIEKLTDKNYKLIETITFFKNNGAPRKARIYQKI